MCLTMRSAGGHRAVRLGHAAARAWASPGVDWALAAAFVAGSASQRSASGISSASNAIPTHPLGATHGLTARGFGSQRSAAMGDGARAGGVAVAMAASHWSAAVNSARLSQAAGAEAGSKGFTGATATSAVDATRALTRAVGAVTLMPVAPVSVRHALLSRSSGALSSRSGPSPFMLTQHRGMAKGGGKKGKGKGGKSGGATPAAAPDDDDDDDDDGGGQATAAAASDAAGDKEGVEYDPGSIVELMEACIESLERDLGKLRVGRASPGMLENLVIVAHGEHTPLQVTPKTQTLHPELHTLHHES